MKYYGFFFSNSQASKHKGKLYSKIEKFNDP